MTVDSTQTAPARPERLIELERTEFGWYAKGHLPKAAVVQYFHDEEYIDITEADVKHACHRFLPIKGEPSDDLLWEEKYSYDEARNGYWYDCPPGRGASPYTFVDAWSGSACGYELPLKETEHEDA
jgi:hypothetical protein